MNIVNGGLYTNEDGLLTKTKRVVKMAIKTTAYTAFLGIAVASALHLYNNPADRASVQNGLKEVGAGIKGQMNDSVFKLTGNNLTTYVSSVTNVTEKGINNTVEAVDEITPNQKGTTEMIHKVEKAGEILKKGVQAESPGIDKTIQKDIDQSPTKIKEDVQNNIKKIRQYTGDLAQRLANTISP